MTTIKSELEVNITNNHNITRNHNVKHKTDLFEEDDLDTNVYKKEKDIVDGIYIDEVEANEPDQWRVIVVDE